jgi:hypothetical protein
LVPCLIRFVKRPSQPSMPGRQTCKIETSPGQKANGFFK